MKTTIKMMMVAMVFGFSMQSAVASDAPDGAKLFDKKCKMCHGIEKKKMGPAAKAMNSDSDALRSAITDGQKRMPAFGKKLSADEINALVTFIQAQK